MVGRDQREGYAFGCVSGRMDTWNAAREKLDALTNQSTQLGALPPDPRLVSHHRLCWGLWRRKIVLDKDSFVMDKTYGRLSNPRSPSQSMNKSVQC